MFARRMGPKVQYFVSVLLSSAQLLLTSPLTQRNHLRIQGGKECKMCPPGQFQKSCDQCAPCPPGSYTADWNHEDSCHRCYGDCRPEFNHKVIENCSSTSNLKCACRDGFRCTSVVAYTDNCKNCVTTTTVTAFAAATTSTTTTATTEDEQTRSSPSSGSRSNSAKLCSFPECDAQPGNNLNAVKEPNPGPHPLAVVFPMVVVVTLALSIWLCICRREEETCLKRAAVKFCNKVSRVRNKSTASVRRYAFPLLLCSSQILRKYECCFGAIFWQSYCQGTMLNWIEELQVTLCFWHLYEVIKLFSSPGGSQCCGQGERAQSARPGWPLRYQTFLFHPSTHVHARHDGMFECERACAQALFMSTMRGRSSSAGSASLPAKWVPSRKSKWRRKTRTRRKTLTWPLLLRGAPKFPCLKRR
ncbi:uncharacterized protein si:dkey-260g12.1 isoform X4 [Syngnathoides biaculeatus]|uniref:uncharacterized protein si:dkey-260g12.1 isoform X4 n=2 Tax=Syngnathoides biaculeatus TaxID=300417 RepID=UPI002ADE5E1D|nr:uncharacterized protein si:dkey-260g12.1 isoform X4 [Syngnathoides biaculeatus]